MVHLTPTTCIDKHDDDDDGGDDDGGGGDDDDDDKSYEILWELGTGKCHIGFLSFFLSFVLSFVHHWFSRYHFIIIILLFNLSFFYRVIIDFQGIILLSLFYHLVYRFFSTCFHHLMFFSFDESSFDTCMAAYYFFVIWCII